MTAQRGRERVELQIVSLAAGGDGVGRAPDGRVVFVPFTAPGDRVQVSLVETRRRWARGQVDALLEPGPDRTDPVCAVFGSCGGCTWQHLAYPAQVSAKAAILRDAFERVGRLPLPGSLAFHPSPKEYGYRLRARVRVERGRVGFRRRRSHRLCATARCPILTPPLQEALAALSSARPEEAGEWQLSAGEDERARVSPPAAAGAADATTVSGPPIHLVVGADRLRISPGVFAQANAGLLPALVAAVSQAVGDGERALELHAGAGLLTLGLARRYDRVVAVESFGPAVVDLRYNLARVGLEHVEVHHASAEAYLADGVDRPDTILLDPPRTGLEPELGAAIAALGAERIVYLSCDPATLARDCAGFASAGYRLAGVEGFDLFPQTPHVEALAVLEHGRSGSG